MVAAADDSWYIRFPDGRVIRAANTTVVRQNIRQRHIPAGSMVRRSGSDSWRLLERTREFADLLGITTGGLDGDSHHDHRPPKDDAASAVSPSSGVATRLDSQRLHSTDVRSVLHEILAALDTALTRRKLIAAALLAGSCGTVLAAAQAVASLATGPVAEYVWPLTALLLLLSSAIGLGLLTRLTCVELRQMRPAYWKEGRAGLGRLTFRLTLAHAVAGVVAIGIPAGFLALARWLPTVQDPPWESCLILANATGVLALVSAVCMLPLMVAAMLLAPILVFEECSVVAALRMWIGLMRRHRGRIILNEAAAVSMALLIALPFVLPVLATGYFPLDERFALAGTCTRTLLTCLTLTPAIGFLVVANVFLFVNLRYEGGRR